MKINHIDIQNYRNIENMSLDFEDVNIIWGENAQGKTNLVEAIYLFTGSKSFRGVKDSQLVMFDKDKSILNIDFQSNTRTESAQIEIKNKRIATLNGIAKKSPAYLGENIKAVIFSPTHLNMIKDGPIQRRKFIDSALCQLKPNYRNVLKQYNKFLLQRNSMLKNNIQDVALYNAWNKSMAEVAGKIIYQRINYINALKPFLSDIFHGLSSGKEQIDVTYSSFIDFNSNDELTKIVDDIYNGLTQSLTKDLYQKSTSIGPHRDDIEILINSNSARLYGSQGQQRSCVLALKLSEAALLYEMTNIKPIALLDDVMSELDESRQDYILNHIKDWQVFITCCDKNQILRSKQGKTFLIQNGKAEPSVNSSS